jgi:hypothetical protein
VCFIFAVRFFSAHGKWIDFTVSSSVQLTAQDVNAECLSFAVCWSGGRTANLLFAVCL